jgi:hypothetical protein
MEILIEAQRREALRVKESLEQHVPIDQDEEGVASSNKQANEEEHRIDPDICHRMHHIMNFT